MLTENDETGNSSEELFMRISHPFFDDEMEIFIMLQRGWENRNREEVASNE